MKHLVFVIVFIIVLPWTLTQDIIDLMLYMLGFRRKQREVLIKLFKGFSLLSIATLLQMHFQPALDAFIGWVRETFSMLTSVEQNQIVCAGSLTVFGRIKVLMCLTSNACSVAGLLITDCMHVIFSWFPYVVFVLFIGISAAIFVQA